MDGIVSFGYWVRRRRKALDLTQSTLAQRVGCSVFTIRKIERDERRPSLQIAELLADQLNIPKEERDNFLRMARGEFVDSMASPLEAVPLPAFMSESKVSFSREDVPFVAREAELARLKGFLDLALAGQGCVVFVTGEAGRGKTALVQEFVRQALEKETSLVAAGGNCNAYSGAGDPYLPFREILGLLTGDVEARWTAGAIEQEQAQRLWSVMPFTIQTLVKRGPDLIDTVISGAELVARTRVVEVTGGTGWQIQLEELVARKAAESGPVNVRQSDLFEQYTRVAKTLAEQQPLLLLLDDLQWADAGSINLLFHLGRRLQGSRILVVGIYRPADVAIGREGERHPLEPVINEFQRHFGDIQVDLRQADGRQFIERFLDSEPNQLGSEFREALYQHTRGHALFTVEMLRGMQERGDIVQDPTGRWIESATIIWDTLPARVEGVIGERVSRLSPQMREALKVASVEGEDFTAEVVAQILAVKETELIRQLSGELDKQHRLIQGRDSRSVGDKRLSHYRFRHILFQRYVYDSLDAVERAYLHQAVGNELEHLHGDQTEEIAGALARHFEAAGLMDKAINYLHQAGERAVHLSANDEAIAHFNHALDLLMSLPDTPDRDRQELTLRMALGAPLTATKGYGAPELEQAFSRARELAPQVGEPTQLFQVLYGVWAYHQVRAELQAAREVAEQMLDLAQHQQDPSLRMPAHWALGNILYWMGEFLLAQQHLEQSMALYDRQYHHAHVLLYGQDQGVTCLSFQAWNLWHLGYPDQALKKSQEALALARKLAHPYSLVYAISWSAWVHLIRREWQKAQEQLEVKISLSAEQGFPFWVVVGNMFLGCTLSHQGRMDEGIALMRHGLENWRMIGAEVARPLNLAQLAEAYKETGQTEEGLDVVAEALAAVEKTRDAHWEAELYRLKGELLLKNEGEKMEDEPSPEACFLRAIEIARRQSAKSLELRAVMSLSRLRQARGKKDEARQMLAEIYSWFTEGFDTLDLKEAAALLEELA